MTTTRWIYLSCQVAAVVCILAAHCPAAGNEIADMIVQAHADGKTEVTIPPGIYTSSNYGVNLKDIGNLTVNGDGVTLLAGIGISLTRCHDMTFSGFTLDQSPLQFTQGTISAVSPPNGPAAAWIEFKVDAGYPQFPVTFKPTSIGIFDPESHQWKRGVPDLYAKDVQTIDADTARLHLASFPDGIVNVKVGDSIVLKSSGISGISVNQCDNLTFKDITLFHSGILVSQSGRGMVLDHITIARGPRPEGATRDRLLAALSDGVHYANSRFGPTIENCDFGFQGDDGVNLHGPTLALVGFEPPRTAWVAYRIKDPLDQLVQPGDMLRCMDPNTYSVMQELTIATIEREQQDLPEALAILRKAIDNKGLDNAFVFKVTIEESLDDLPLGVVCDIPQLNCPNFVIRNNVFHDNRGRGLRIDASDGVIEHNRIERTKMAGIALGPEYPFWGEAGWVTNVQIIGNHLTDINTYSTTAVNGWPDGGAISVGVKLPITWDKKLSSTTTVPSGNRKIVIRGNVIDRAALNGIYINAASDVLVEDNKMRETNYYQAAGRDRHLYRLNIGKGIDVTNSKQVVLKNNQIERNKAKPQAKRR
ncbi:right-handed parallel beta-helix repeat-containing protein [Schlesneria paludicola]|uniref:right-handed parallel beta-helix repeat-containing protein n=1 Tax=Schlesneria paludicola TaxID=360056 RepID=UPI00029B16A7|nr:right-handed parallel beta-helix repeat-containing protein [Schlesneria paludicola]